MNNHQKTLALSIGLNYFNEEQDSTGEYILATDAAYNLLLEQSAFLSGCSDDEIKQAMLDCCKAIQGRGLYD